jgi:citrate lyase subunit alpha/citrate CoA-transferase
VVQWRQVVGGLREAIIASGLKDGMTIPTHHHLRNGDRLLNDVVKEIDALGICDIRIAASSVHIVHAELIPYIRKGVIGHRLRLLDFRRRDRGN